MRPRISIRGFVRRSVGRSVGPWVCNAFLINCEQKFKQIQVNSRKFRICASIGRVGLVFLLKKCHWLQDQLIFLNCASVTDLGQVFSKRQKVFWGFHYIESELNIFLWRCLFSFFQEHLETHLNLKLLFFLHFLYILIIEGQKRRPPTPLTPNPISRVDLRLRSSSLVSAVLAAGLWSLYFSVPWIKRVIFRPFNALLLLHEPPSNNIFLPAYSYLLFTLFHYIFRLQFNRSIFFRPPR